MENRQTVQQPSPSTPPPPARKLVWQRPRLVELAMRDTQSAGSGGPEGSVTMNDQTPTGGS